MYIAEVTVVVPKKAIYRLTRNMTYFNTSHKPSHHHTDTTATLDVTTALGSSMYMGHNRELVVKNLWLRIVMEVEIYRALKSDIPEDGRAINFRNASGV